MSLSQQLHTRYLNQIHRQQRLFPYLFLHFDPVSRNLVSWFWPISQDRARVTPSDLLAYRTLHDFRAPCCLCAVSTIGGLYTECAIYLAVQGQYTGEYVCGCAFNSCGYLVSLDRMYARRGLLIDYYPLRPAGQAAPPPVYYLPHDGAEKTLTIRGSNEVLPALQTHRRPTKRRDILDLFLRLDSRENTGLTEHEFQSLFVRCECGLIMTHWVFYNHTCAVPAGPTIIDLTLDGDDDISVPVIIDLTGDDDLQ